MRNKGLVLLVCLLFAAFAVIGCAAEPQASQSAAAEESASAAPSEAAEETPEESPSESAQSIASEEAEASGEDAGLGPRSITDMAGRSVDIPAEINKIYATTPVGAIYVYTIDPEKLLGWNYQLNEWEKRYILPEYQDLPVYGMNDNLNLEALIAAKPDVILQVAGLGDKAKEQADSLSSQTGIPVLMYSMDLTDTPLVYEHMGLLLNEEDRAKELAEYSGSVISEAQASAPADDRVTVYYGNGPQSLNTAPQGSDAFEVIELAGGVNCAAIELQADEGPTERVDISPEQLLAWNPDVIFVNGEPKEDLSAQAAADAILNDPTYASLEAVANGRVYGVPQTPFSWIDRPKGPNRIIGITWAQAELYPDEHPAEELTKAVQDFYSLFYHVDITSEDVAQLPSD